MSWLDFLEFAKTTFNLNIIFTRNPDGLLQEHFFQET
jgi:hypothetical protein